MKDALLMKDSPLKLRIRRILWAQGYHCPLEVDLSHYENENTKQPLKRTSFTDIDVLGIRFEPDLRSTMIIADCKSGKESEPNRIFWLRGVMDFFGAQEGIFLKSIVHSHARALASKLSIRVLDERGLDILEKSLLLDVLPIDVGNAVIYTKMTSLWGIEVKVDQKPTERQLILKKVYHYLQYMYWIVSDYRNIQTIMEYFSEIKGDLASDDPRSKYLVYVGLQRLTLSITRMASNIAIRDINDIKKQFLISFFGGELRLRERLQIIDLLNELGEQKRLNEKINLEPPYFDELAEIVNKIILNSRHAVKILQHLDAIIIEHLFGSKRELEKALGLMYSTDALVLTKRVATMFQKYTGLDEGLFEDLRTL